MMDRMEDFELDDQSGSEQDRLEPVDREDSIEGSQTQELDDATLEPAARIEATGDFVQAEAIEASLTELVDSTSESSPEGGKGAFGQETSDPGRHYSGVQMTQGDVQSDQDWNEGADPPQTEEMEDAVTGAFHIRFAIADHQVEDEAVNGSEFMGYAKSVKGGTAKAELATHELGEENIERKNIPTASFESPPGGPVLDVRHIPAGEFDGEEGSSTKLEDDDLMADPSEASLSDQEESNGDD